MFLGVLRKAPDNPPEAGHCRVAGHRLGVQPTSSRARGGDQNPGWKRRLSQSRDRTQGKISGKKLNAEESHTGSTDDKNVRQVGGTLQEESVKVDDRTYTSKYALKHNKRTFEGLDAWQNDRTSMYVDKQGEIKTGSLSRSRSRSQLQQ